MSEFAKAWSGRFESLLSWEDFDGFWDRLKADFNHDWYIYVPGSEIPSAPSNPEKTIEFLDKVAKLIHREHDARYCGIVYVDDKKDPGFIKIYDPDNLGASCGYSENPPLPAWVMSKLQPENIERFNVVNIIPNNRKTWWQKIFSHA